MSLESAMTLRERLAEAGQEWLATRAEPKLKCVFGEAIGCCRVRCRHPEGSRLLDGQPTVPAHCTAQRCRFYCEGIAEGSGWCKQRGSVVLAGDCAACRAGTAGPAPAAVLAPSEKTG